METEKIEKGKMNKIMLTLKDVYNIMEASRLDNALINLKEIIESKDIAVRNLKIKLSKLSRISYRKS